MKPLLVRLGLDNMQYMRKLKRTQRETNRALRNVQRRADAINFKKAAITLAAFGTAVTYTSLKLVKIASDAEETNSKFNTVFRDLSKTANTWATDFGDSVGRAHQDVKKWMAGLQDTFVPLGFARDRSLELAQSLTKLAVDVASFNNAADADVIRDFTSALVGNHETVRKYGIIISENTIKQEALQQGIRKSYQNLTDLEKVQMRYNIILNGTSDAQGDALRTADSYANQVKRMKANMTNLAKSIGNELLPTFTDIVKQTNEWIKANKDLVQTKSAEWIETVRASLVSLINFTKENQSSIIETMKWVAGIYVAAKVISFTVKIAALVKALAALVAVAASPIGLGIFTALAVGGGVVAGVAKLREHLERIESLKFDNVRELKENTELNIQQKNLNDFRDRLVELQGEGKTLAEVVANLNENFGDATAIKNYGVSLAELNRIAHRIYRNIELKTPLEPATKAAIQQERSSYTTGLTLGGRMSDAQKMLHGPAYDPRAPLEMKTSIFAAKSSELLSESRKNLQSAKDYLEKAVDNSFDHMTRRAQEFGAFWGSWLFNIASDADVSFDSILNSFYRMMANMATQAAATSLFSMIIPGGQTIGFFDALKSILPGFAEGGMVNRPTLAMVGEKGPERILSPEETKRYNLIPAFASPLSLAKPSLAMVGETRQYNSTSNDDHSSISVTFGGDTGRGLFSNRYAFAKALKEMIRTDQYGIKTALKSA